jgi:transposase
LKLRDGLSAQRVYQDLVEENGFTGSYESVKRYARRLEGSVTPPFRRMEVEPGKELQVDFGRGAPIADGSGKRRCPHLFRTVLSHSRKGYSEVVFRQTTEDFIRVLENAFRAYGGVAETLVVDNLKAAVIHADWFDPEINPKVRSFCEHYGTVILPTRPRIPRHKGKIERGIAFAQSNALKGRVFKSLAEQNEHLALWEERTADTRLHGTTKTQVRAAFELERAFLQPLPAMLFPCFKEARRSVHQDGHIEFEKSYYSVPPEHKGREVIVRADTRMVRIFSPDMRDLAVHARVEPGKFSTQDRHIHREKRSEAERGSGWLVRRAHLIGANCGRWAERVTKQRGVQSLRTIQGLLALARKHGSRSMDEACRRALDKELLHLREVRRLIGGGDDQPRLEFAQEHPLIRDMGFYGGIVPFDGGKDEEAMP